MMIIKSRVKITLFKWAGSWWHFKIKTHCGECTLTRDIIQDTLRNELAGIPVELEERDWLSEWWRPLMKGGWHAPIVMVDGSVISQGAALNRGVLTQAVIESYSREAGIQGNHLFGKDNCPHCKRAKEYLERSGIDYYYHNVIGSSRDLYEMLARVKPILGFRQPVTVPQIWLDGKYAGGADELGEALKEGAGRGHDSGLCHDR